jgi:hypothetical protein
MVQGELFQVRRIGDYFVHLHPAVTLPPSPPPKLTPLPDLMPGEQTKPARFPETASAYSLWHRSKIFEGCFTVDVDYVEFRNGRGVVALICVTSRLNDVQHMDNSKSMIFERSKAERRQLWFLSSSAGVPAYYVIHLTDLTVFDVYRVFEDGELHDFLRMDRDRYVQFIRGL